MLKHKQESCFSRQTFFAVLSFIVIDHFSLILLFKIQSFCFLPSQFTKLNEKISLTRIGCSCPRQSLLRHLYSHIKSLH